MSIWVLMESRDGGATWALVRGNNSFYRQQGTCETRAKQDTDWHAKLPAGARAHGYKYKAEEFKESTQ